MTMETLSYHRRGSHEIIYDMLKIVRQPIKKTVLMYGSNIGLATFKRLMPLLLERGLVKKVPFVTARGRRLSKATPYLFVITDKGEALVRLYHQIYDILGWGPR